ncbi:putative lipid II flippase FtsW [Lacisediminihabitans profunda]|uniref:Probable peptidoglycan glycosyltransferase FtsW n=1 Tax=Lacisediminihabitans profunda TaxID=2594790 RepID=A0A5C8USU4_9MICO|nr:putative lipid II flippase FtsW [Lacisediminihabitans profunda]TXN30681.1 putative lipid II flippase FtsW [Lacisediminihabitans profunda]
MTTSLPRPRATNSRTSQPAQARRPTRTTGAAPRPTAGQPAAEAREPRHAPAAFVAVRRIFAAETGNYFVLLGATLFLVVFGLIMVLSSSSVESFLASGDFFNGFVRQVLFAALGIPLMLIASRMPARFWKRWAGTFLLIAIVLQLLVVATPLGVEHGGNKNWISLGPFSGQPSELVKLGLVAWLGYILARKQGSFDNWRELVMPLVPVAGAAIGFVVLGGDLGTSIILTMVVLGAVYFAGVRLRFLAVPILLIAFAATILSLASTSRRDRIAAFASGCTSASDYLGNCFQTVQGWWALASGGVFGVGLGNSKAKYSWLPEADNDFIFAIIGEELGLIGAILVLALFIVLAISFVRIIRANTDPFARITVSAVMVWIIGQAFVNIAVVLGILPVLGVPLPLISAGGSALITSLIAIGIVLSFARQSPEPALDTPRTGRSR